jgi:hypothetical protein
MSDTFTAFMNSLSAEETLEFAQELERRRARIDALQAKAFARLTLLREDESPVEVRS